MRSNAFGPARWGRPALVVALTIAALAPSLSGYASGVAGLLAAAAVLTLGALALAPARAKGPGATERPRAGDPLSHALAARLPDPLVLVDRRAVVASANEAARRILPALRPGSPLSLALRAPEVLESVAHVLGAGEDADVVYGGRGPNDPIYEVRVRKLAPADRAEPAAALFFRDLTPQRRAESMRVDFIANVSHELRTPLASLLGFIETLQGPAREDARARAQFLSIMGDQARRMARLIDDLLQLSRVEMHAHVAPDRPLDLGPVIGQEVDVMTPLARERGVELAYTAPDAPAWILGDRDEMIRVAENLIENAIRYGSAGKRVEIAVSHVAGPGPSPAVDVTVRDYGEGIAPEHLPRLTERFYRVDAGQSRSQGGTGLGLAIVKHVVGRHRGRLAIESGPGTGTLVRVTLPGYAAAPHARPEPVVTQPS